MNNSIPTLEQVTRILDGFYPPATAQSWDAVGLVSGDLAQPISHVMFAVDPTLDVIHDAVEAGANLLVTHHPLMMRGVKTVATNTSKGRAVTALIVGDVAAYAAHTNADVATPGVNDALAHACGLEDCEPLTKPEGQPLGRIGDLPAAVTLREFADRLASVLPAAPVGIRVSGDPAALIRRVAVLGGAGDSEFDAAREGGADIYVTADLRHHPVLEEREKDGERPLAIIDAGHWATESLWLSQAAQRLQQALADQGLSITTQISTRCTDPWDFLVATKKENTHEG